MSGLKYTTQKNLSLCGESRLATYLYLMKILIIKLFIIAYCNGYSNGSYQYEAKSSNDTSTYIVYSLAKYNVGDTIQYKLK
jgi:hypothetical protein